MKLNPVFLEVNHNIHYGGFREVGRQMLLSISNRIYMNTLNKVAEEVKNNCITLTKDQLYDKMYESTYET